MGSLYIHTAVSMSMCYTSTRERVSNNVLHAISFIYLWVHAVDDNYTFSLSLFIHFFFTETQLTVKVNVRNNFVLFARQIKFDILVLVAFVHMLYYFLWKGRLIVYFFLFFDDSSQHIILRVNIFVILDDIYQFIIWSLLVIRISWSNGLIMHTF